MEKETKTRVDIESSGGISEAFEIAAKHGQAEVNLKIPVPPSVIEKHGNALEKLRVRGTPIELIFSYLIADKLDQARAAFRTTILELVYEQMKEEGIEVEFKNSLTFKRDEDDPNSLALTLNVEWDKLNVGIALDEKHDDAPSKKSHVTAHMAVINSIEPREHKITDSPTTAVMGLIADISDDVMKIIKAHRIRCNNNYGEGTMRCFIVPDCSEVQLGTNDAPKIDRVVGWANIALCAFWLNAK
jgi:hypothetical protein